jgi:hypothetical protein
MGSEIWLFLIFLLFQNKQQKMMPAMTNRLGITPATMNLAGVWCLEELADTDVEFPVAEAAVMKLVVGDKLDRVLEDDAEVDGIAFVSFFI